ncbi:MAG: hypothetical protein ACFCD0_10505 [Gemmataceae bacterium]
MQTPLEQAVDVLLRLRCQGAENTLAFLCNPLAEQDCLQSEFDHGIVTFAKGEVSGW